MSDWRPPGPLHDEDIEAADRLLDQADALLRRHRGADAPAEHVALDGDDLPILTDMVDESDPELPLLVDAAPPAAAAPFAGPAPVAQAGPPPATAAPSSAELSRELAEHLIRLDTEIAREIEGWINRELPQLLSREFDAFSERLRQEALDHLRATLLPRLSDRIASHLEEPDETR